MMNFKDLKKTNLLNDATLIKISSVWRLLRSARSVYCQLHLCLIQFTQNHFLFKKKADISEFLYPKTVD